MTETSTTAATHAPPPDGAASSIEPTGGRAIGRGDMSRLKLLGSLVLTLAPWPIRRRLLNALFGYEIAPSARIGLSLVALDKLVMGEHSRIGHLNVIKSFDRLEMGAHARIGSRNYMSGLGSRSKKHFQDEAGRAPELIMGEHASITGRHLVDCCNRITIGAFTTIAGAGTHILTHAISIKENRQRSGGVSIGRYCFIGSASVILKGAALPDFSVLAANSTLHRANTLTHHIYSGVPAEPVRALDEASAYFHRTTGHVP